jgi:glycosyltransferase involved in cell wall biosynthesis
MINRVVIGGIFSFPEGEAFSFRVKNLILGFLDHTPHVSVISMYERNKSLSYKGGGTFDINGKLIQYTCISPFQKESSNFVQRGKNRVNYLLNYRKLANELINQLRGDEEELLFLYGRSFIFLSYLLKLKRKKNIKTKFIFDVVEPPRTSSSYFEYVLHPFVWDSVLVFHKLLPKFDGITFITYKLKEKFGEKVNNGIIAPYFVYEYNSKPVGLINSRKIQLAYLGALIEKDYPELLYKVCNDLFNENIEFDLKIIGRFDLFEEGRFWKSKFINSPFSANVNFYFDVSENEKIRLINSIDFLCLFRKPEMVQEFTFPTRVVEVLSFGKVVIINGFGDLVRYFKHGENAIIIDENTKDFALRIKGFCNIEKYDNLVSGSKKLLLDDFNTKVIAQRILNSF